MHPEVCQFFPQPNMGDEMEHCSLPVKEVHSQDGFDGQVVDSHRAGKRRTINQDEPGKMNQAVRPKLVEPDKTLNKEEK